MSQNTPGLLRNLLFVGLLIGSFFLGVSWKGTPNETDSTANNTTADIPPDESTAEEAPSAPLPSPPDARLDPAELATIRLFEAAAPSVAFITTSNLRQNYWTRDLTEIPRGTGSGFVWDKKGHIITNYHVIDGADKAQVTLGDGSSWAAQLVGVAPEKDLAVLKIDIDASQLKPIPIGRSSNLRVGQSVYAIGNPFGLDQTLTTGIISALGREIESQGRVPIRDVIQTDAAINPGNSGGPLLNSSGQLIAVNTAIYSPSGAYAGIGFSIPVDVVNWVVNDLIEFGKVIRPTLGVELATAQIAQRLGLEGALVLNVVAGSAAERAGIQPTTRDRRGNIQIGDLIIAIEGEAVRSNADLILALEKYQAGDQVTVKVQRDDQLIDLSADLDMGR